MKRLPPKPQNQLQTPNTPASMKAASSRFMAITSSCCVVAVSSLSRSVTRALRPISSVDAFAPDIDPRSTWYDEMLVSGNTVVVIGYSYQRGGTEVGLFDITSEGQTLLSLDVSPALQRLLFFAQLREPSHRQQVDLLRSSISCMPALTDPFQSFPAVRKWHKGATRDRVSTHCSGHSRLPSRNRLQRRLRHGAAHGDRL